jgi:hypothetical protein
MVFVVLAAVSPAWAQNQPPRAEPRTVFTNGTEPLEIILRGSDPEGRDLRFAIIRSPAFGLLSTPREIVPEPAIDPRTGQPVQPPVTSASVVYRLEKQAPDSFTFAVVDAEGASGLAVVTINPFPDEPPPPPVTTVIAQDTAGEVFRDTQSMLTMTGAAPDGVSLTFALLTKPFHGVLGELAQGSEKPQRTATVAYTPNPGYTGKDEFDLAACGFIGEQLVCDSALYTINVVERPQEPVVLVSDIQARTPMNRKVRFSLENDHRLPVIGKPMTLHAVMAGNVADADGDGRGDNRNELPGPKPLFMSAGVDRQGEPGIKGTARMHMEFDLGGLESVKEVARAVVVLRTHRASKEGLATQFFAAGEGDGKLAESDFESEAEPVSRAVMPIPSLEEMPVDAEGTLTFEVLGELRAALRDGLRVLSLQGRVDERTKGPAAGLDVRTTADDNLREHLEPALTLEPAVAQKPLLYTVLSLPEFGTLLDSAGNPIREVPYSLPNPAEVTYVPPTELIGQVAFRFQATDGLLTQAASAIITTFFGHCRDDADFCNNGR